MSLTEDLEAAAEIVECHCLEPCPRKDLAARIREHAKADYEGVIASVAGALKKAISELKKARKRTEMMQ